MKLFVETICQIAVQEYHLSSGVRDNSAIASRPGTSTGGGRPASLQDFSGLSKRGLKRKAKSGQNLATMENSCKEMVAILRRNVDLCQREIVLQERQVSALASVISALSAATIQQWLFDRNPDAKAWHQDHLTSRPMGFQCSVMYCGGTQGLTGDGLLSKIYSSSQNLLALSRSSVTSF